MRFMKFAVLLSVLCIVLTGIIHAPVPVLAQLSSNVEPRSGHPGTTFRFFANGFRASEIVGYWVNTPDGSVISDNAYTVMANEQGRADWSWQAPQSLLPGSYTMVARGTERGRQHVIGFEIGDPGAQPSVAPPSQPEPSAPVMIPQPEGKGVEWNMVPEVGGPNSRFAFFATGFRGDEKVNFWVNALDGGVISDASYTVLARDGRADWVWQAPPYISEGTYTMVAFGVKSELEWVIPFRIDPDMALPVLAQDPRVKAKEGTEDGHNVFVFFAEGFEVKEIVRYWVHFPDGENVGKRGYYVMTNEFGRADWEWKAPTPSIPGVYAMVAYGTESETEQVIQFEISSP